ncbi:MAG: class I SAM-dependent methyltransferase, partial [Proteobacteria bacterium]|nr:class I SAM-dependent methyltransferase [Pseudomonadota bacterium]
MANLYILSASYRHLVGVEGLLNALLSGQSDLARRGAVLLYPAGVRVDAALCAENIAYDDEIGLEKNPTVWRPLCERQFTGIFIFGTDVLADFEEIILACYLNGLKKVFVDGRGMHDLARWQDQVKPNLSARSVQVRRLDADAQRDYFRTVHRWLGSELIKADFNPPVRMAERSPDLWLYSKFRLATDLAQQTVELQREEHGSSFSILRCLDGSLVHSSDFYRAIANFIGAIKGMETVLDVGCGSGFLACHLAASGRYRDVHGIDASPERVSGARLYAELNQSSARFDAMSMSSIPLPSGSVDMTVTSFALEQTGDHLERCFAEIRRVTRKLIVLVEPSNEFFATLPSMWHVPSCGWANQYQSMLMRSNLAFATRPNLLSHYFNPGTVFVIDVESREHPRFRYPELFGVGLH